MRLQVNINEQMSRKIDKYCDELSVSRSSLCAMLIGQGLMGLDKSFSVVDGIEEKLNLAGLADELASGLRSDVKACLEDR